MRIERRYFATNLRRKRSGGFPIALKPMLNTPFFYEGTEPLILRSFPKLFGLLTLDLPVYLTGG
jgi:hypothetical protein